MKSAVGWLKLHLRKVGLYVLCIVALAFSFVAFPENTDSWLVNEWETLLDYSSRTRQLEYIPLRKAKEKWHLCVSFPHLKDPYWVAVNYGVIDQARILGVRVTLVEAGGYPNIDKQSRQIESCTQLDVDGLIVGSTSYDKLAPILKPLSEKLPVFSLVNPIRSDLAFSQSAIDFWNMGKSIGLYLAARHPKGSQPVKVAWFPGPKSLGWVQRSDEGFKAAITNSSAQVVSTFYGDTGKEIQRKLITQALDEHPDIDYLIGVSVAINAAIDEVRKRGLEHRVKLLSDYVTPRIYRGILNGEVEAASTDSPVLQGRIAVDQAVRKLEGRKVHRHVGPSVFVVDANNISTVPMEQTLAPSSFTPLYYSEELADNCNVTFGVVHSPPYQIVDRELSSVFGHIPRGLDIDIAKTVLGRLGCKLTFKVLPQQRALNMFKTGEIDMMGSTLKTPELRGIASFSKPYHSVRLSLFVTSDQGAGYTTLERYLSGGSSVATAHGVIFGRSVDDVLRKHPNQVVRVNNQDQSMRLLVSSRVDSVIMDPATAKYYMKRMIKLNPDADRIHRAYLHLGMPRTYQFVFSKRSVPLSLVTQFNDELTRLMETDKYDGLIDRYKN